MPGAARGQHAQGTTSQREVFDDGGEAGAGTAGSGSWRLGHCVCFIHPTCRAMGDMMRARLGWQRHNPICALCIESGFSGGQMKLGIASLAFLAVISQQKIFPGPLSVRILLSPLLQ